MLRRSTHETTGVLFPVIKKFAWWSSNLSFWIWRQTHKLKFELHLHHFLIWGCAVGATGRIPGRSVVPCSVVRIANLAYVEFVSMGPARRPYCSIGKNRQSCPIIIPVNFTIVRLNLPYINLSYHNQNNVLF
jgi:hypothetical protein